MSKINWMLGRYYETVDGTVLRYVEYDDDDDQYPYLMKDIHGTYEEWHMEDGRQGRYDSMLDPMRVVGPTAKIPKPKFDWSVGDTYVLGDDDGTFVTVTGISDELKDWPWAVTAEDGDGTAYCYNIRGQCADDPDDLELTIVEKDDHVGWLGLRANPTDPKRIVKGEDGKWKVESTGTKLAANTTLNGTDKTTIGAEAPKEESKNNMNFKKLLGVTFGKNTSNEVSLTAAGVAVALAGNQEYAAFNGSELTRVPAGMAMGGDFLYNMPVQATDVKKGDLILNNSGGNGGSDLYLFVTDIKKNGNIVGINPRNSKEETLVPSSNMFGMKLFTKVVSMMNFGGDNNANLNQLMMFGMMGEGKSDPLEMMMLSQFMGGGNTTMDFSKNPMAMMMFMGKGEGKSDLSEMLMLTQLMSGNNFFGSQKE
jgi:hypothetical protein